MKKMPAVLWLVAALLAAGLDVPAAASDTISLTGAGGRTPVASAGCSQATTFLARTSGLNTAHQNAYTALICGLVTDGVWTLLDGLYIFATDTQTNAVLSLVSSSFPVTVNGTLTFTADNGYSAAQAGANLNTTFNPSTAPSPNFVQDSAFAGLWRLNNVEEGEDQWRQGGQAVKNSIWSRFTDGHMYCDINASSDDGVGVAVASADGFSSCARTASTGYSYYKNGSASGLTPRVNASTAIVSGTFLYLVGVGTGDVAAGVFGSGLNGSQMASVYARIHSYMQTIAGAP